MQRLVRDSVIMPPLRESGPGREREGKSALCATAEMRSRLLLSHTVVCAEVEIPIN